MQLLLTNRGERIELILPFIMVRDSRAATGNVKHFGTARSLSYLSLPVSCHLLPSLSVALAVCSRVHRSSSNERQLSARGPACEKTKLR